MLIEFKKGAFHGMWFQSLA